ncbi:SAM-dependent methyltransferase [Saccharothrix syringae]|uniref:Class I SAM-dependent methyltransferase n=1 Tax=Saccharothrix syringae TaxID=103733 RepID=A0A5Q0H6Y9_SACSY|nr:cyclopropane-fatty-acyl-phospholipid synthase family protein [Saccharothrix syringae]QFZ21987.1 class I SAM-dependent methyltransferase [Saccharothrix syringae]
MSTVDLPRPGAWPGLWDPPRSPWRARAAEALFRRAARTLPVRVLLPDGRRLGAGGPGAPVMLLHRPEAFFHRLGADAKIGFGEAYMTGDWTSPDLAELLTAFAARLTGLVPPVLQPLRRWVERRQPAAERNDPAGARRNVQRHYDLSNDLFRVFLDETMTYSSAWFATPDQPLADAQMRKVDGVLDYAGVRSGTRLLEIGTGWGALAVRAARRGAEVTTLTLSAEQKALAERRAREAGVADRVTVHLRDYREERGRYDAAVSVEMIEAVGAEYWPAYFAAVDRSLVPGGRFGLQAITMPHDRMLATAAGYTWFHKYIFPGGLIPSVRAIEDTARDRTALRVTDSRAFGRDYAETLRRWREAFLRRWDEVAALGFDATFKRMWEFYLAYSEAGFRVGYLDVRQFAFAK